MGTQTDSSEAGKVAQEMRIVMLGNGGVGTPDGPKLS